LLSASVHFEGDPNGSMQCTNISQPRMTLQPPTKEEKTYMLLKHSGFLLLTRRGDPGRVLTSATWRDQRPHWKLW